MRKLSLAGLALATALAIAPAASASNTQLYFTYTGTPTGSSGGISGVGMSGSGVLNVTPYGGGYFVTGGYGIEINGAAGSLVLPTNLPAGNIQNVNSSLYYDNILMLGSSINDVDNNGIAFTLPGGQLASLWLDGNGDVLSFYNPALNTWNPVSADGYDISMRVIIDTPEPASLLLLGTGLFLLAGLVFWKAKRPSALMASMN